MGEVVNLRTVRKRKAREDAARQADASRARHGIGKAERTSVEAARQAEARRLDGHRRERAGSGDDEA